MKYVLIFAIEMIWTSGICGTSVDPDNDWINLRGDLRQEFVDLDACNRALRAVSITVKHRGRALHLDGTGRCEPIKDY